MATYTTTVNREGKNAGGEEGEFEVNIEVEYTHYRARRGARDSLGGVRGAGPALEPDEDEHIEIVSVTDVDSGNEVELTASEEEKIEIEIIESIEDSRYSED